MTTTAQSVLNSCAMLSLEELRLVNQNIVAMIQNRRDAQGQVKKAQMYVGQRVKTTTSGNGLYAGDEGVIEKINPKRIKVKFDRKPHAIYNCPPQLIEPV